jgi:ankyrin repeat protein
MSDPESDFYGIRALSGVDALGIAAVNSKLKEMKLLLADGVDINGVAAYSKSTALCSAAADGATRSVTLLIENGADVNRPDANGLTPLLHACAKGMKKGLKIAEELIAAGADVNYVRAVDEMTALKFSIQGQNAELIELLLDKGADPDGPPGTRQTALMLAARNNFVGALKVLIDRGADPTLTCKLPWAENRTAEGLAELEKRRQAVAFFKSLRQP